MLVFNVSTLMCLFACHDEALILPWRPCHALVHHLLYLAMLFFLTLLIGATIEEQYDVHARIQSEDIAVIVSLQSCSSNVHC